MSGALPEHKSGAGPDASPTASQRVLAYARLLRLSNGPTAIADVWMGYAVAGGDLRPTPMLACLTLASLCLYHAGMALNDAVDADADERDDRGRPIAGGRVQRRVAYQLAYALLGVGLAAATAASWLARSPAAAVTAVAIAAAVVAYNSPVKRTAVGPVFMATCRVLNGVLGMSVAVSDDAVLAVAPGVFAYVAGLTWFARNEAVGGRRFGLAMAVSLASSAFVWFAVGTPRVYPAVRPVETGLVWGVVALASLRGMAAAVLQPTPARIGRGVGLAIQGLVLINAVLASLYAGPVAGLAIFALLPVTMLLARWIPQT